MGLYILPRLQQSEADARQSAESDEATTGGLLGIRARDVFDEKNESAAPMSNPCK